METIECLFCADADSDVAIEEAGYTGRKCRGCGLVFVSPRPTATEIADLYRNDGAHISAAAHLAKHESPAMRRATERRVELLRRHVPGGSMLELGAGAGTLVAAARDAGFDVAAVEPNRAQAAFIRGELGIPCAESSETVAEEIGRDRFDLVYFANVLSHFYDPVAELRLLHGLLAPGGHLVFETGNIGDVAPRYLGYYTRFQYPDHLFFFSERSLARLLAETGFEHVRTYRWSMLPLLAVDRVVRRVLFGPGRRSTAATTGGSNGSRPPAARAALGMYESLLSALLYRVGAIAPKERRPQTLVVVARKLPLEPDEER